MKNKVSLSKGSLLFFLSLILTAVVMLTGILVLAGGSSSVMYSKPFTLFDWNIDGFGGNTNYEIAWLRSHCYNVVQIQEDFSKTIYNDIPNWPCDCPYRSHTGRTCGAFDFYDSGLTQSASFDLRHSVFRCWNDSATLDQFAAKGFMLDVRYIPVTNSSGKTYKFPLHFYNVHFQADSQYQAIRKKQIAQLETFMNQISKELPIIIAGDFNIEWANTSHRYDLTSFATRQNLTMANNVESNPQEYTNPKNQTLDYVMFRSGTDSRQSLQKTSFKVEKSAQGSDHYALKADLLYQADANAYPDLVVTDILQFTYTEWDMVGYATAIVKNNGPASTNKGCSMYMTVSGIKTGYGLGYCPPLSSGQSAVVEIEYPELSLPADYTQAKIYVTVDRNADTLAFLCRYGDIKENNEMNNVFSKNVVILRQT